MHWPEEHKLVVRMSIETCTTAVRYSGVYESAQSDRKISTSPLVSKAYL